MAKGPCRLPCILLIALQPITLVSLYFSTFLCDVVPVLGCNLEAFDGIASPKMHLYPYLIAHALNSSAETLGIRSYHVYVGVAVISTSVIAPRPGLGLCVAVFEAGPSLKSTLYVGYLHHVVCHGEKLSAL